MSGIEKRIFCFGVFEADAGTGELRKAGMRLRLQEQPFQVLVLLLQHPGEIVTREEIRQKLWPSDTFVDFDHSLNTTINKIRDALKDSASNPRFIETLAKRGYRFLLPVKAVAVPVSSAGFSTDLEIEKRSIHAASQDSPSASLLGLTRLEELPLVSSPYVRVFFLLIQVMYLVFYVVALWRIGPVQDLLERAFGGHLWPIIVVIASASVGVPVRLYMLTAVSFGVEDFGHKFLTIFPGMLVLDELWALAPFLLARQIGIGLALGATAALAYAPFAQRTLVLMRDRADKGLKS